MKTPCENPLALPTPPDVDQGVAAASLEDNTSCAEEKILRNEAILSVVSGPLCALSSEVEATDALNATDKPAELKGNLTNHHPKELPDVMTPAHFEWESLRSEAGGDLLEAMIDIERMRREFEKRTPFRAQRSRKPNDRVQREEEAAEAALRSLLGECES